ncbi:MAG: efflux RND transporter periplasmic adaptor subunit [Planctomycetaceae bacterium]
MWHRIQTVLIFSVVCVVGLWGVWKLWPHAAEVAAFGPDDASTPLLTLPAEKISAIGIEREVAEKRPLQRTLSAPGRLQYDDTRHIEVKTATDGVLVEVRVKPGDRVETGAIVAVVSSPEVGTARADVLERVAGELVAVEFKDWKLATCEGLERLAQSVQAEKTLEEIRREFQSVQLGSAREQILSAFGKFTLARSVASQMESASSTGAVPQRTIQEAVSARDTTAAALDSILEQSLFDARQQCRQAVNAAADAQRRLQISRQHLRTLLGFVGEMSSQGDGMGEAIDPQSNLSLVEVRAPFAGSIEKKVFSASERVAQGDTLFVLADTTRLWISADLREREWEAAQLQPGDPLQVSFPALGDTSFPARVYFVGREVDLQTNALPLVATIDNPEGQLRPGMFAEITLPVGQVSQMLTVPESAILEHQGAKFVFSPESESSFRRIDIKTGLQQGDWLEVRNGLTEGMPIVTAGGFQLKSELLLERDE